MHATVPEPRTAFEWPVYAEATFAGLSVLIPIPLVDWFFETYFRGRIPGSIGRYRKQPVPYEIAGALNRSNEACAQSCLLLPFRALFELVKRISRKLLYFLTIAEAAERLSYYWHRAFLIDYMLLAGHLNEVNTAVAAREAMKQVLTLSTTNPLTHLARQVTASSRRIFGSLRRARHGTEDAAIQEKKSIIAQHWDEFAGYLRSLAAQYQQAYERANSSSIPEETHATDNKS